MPHPLLGALSFVALSIAIFLGIHIGIALLLIGSAGITLILGFKPALDALAYLCFYKLATYDLAIFPLFMLMGEFASVGPVVSGLFTWAKTWFGRFPGGLGLTVLAANTALAACVGSTIASAGSMTRVALPVMIKNRYKPEIGGAIIAATGTFAIMIPPSIFLALYAILTQQSVGDMLLAGVIPGFFSAIIYFAYISIRAYLSPQLMPPGASSTWKEKLVSLKYTPSFVIIIAVMIGGLYGGVFAPSEVGAIAAFVTFVLALPTMMKDWRSGFNAIWTTGANVGMIFIVIMGAFVFSRFITLSGAPELVSDWVVALAVSKWIKLAAVVVLYIVLGCFLDTIGMMTVTLPVVFPAMVALGFNPVWFGILVVKLAELGGLTPPFGFTVFVVKGVAGDVMELGALYKACIPFMLLDALLVLLLILMPQLSLWLPTLAHAR